MNSAAHRIRRQRWEVRVADRDTAFALRAQLRRDLDSVLLPAMAQAFDALGSGDEVVHIPRLTLRMRVRNLDELAAQLPAQVAQQLGAVLGAAAGGVADNGAETPRRRSAAEQRRASLLHYLRGGQLEWLEPRDDVATRAARLREEAVQVARIWRDDPAAMQHALPAVYDAAVVFFFRFLHLLPTSLSGEWLPALLAAAPGGGPRDTLLAGMQALPLRIALPAPSLLHVRAISLGLAWAERVPPDAELLAGLRALPGLDRLNAGRLESLLNVDRGGPRSAREPVADATRQAAKSGRARAGVQGIDERDGRPGDDLLFDAPNTGLPLADAEDQAGVRVQAAGLVLAHPFLASLFAARGLLGEDGKTLSPHHLPRAAALLHWLACWREEIFEFELGLIKPLLGLRPENPLPVSLGLLDADDRAECQALLTAMISHWPALRATSLAGLRVSFLQRSGLLRLAEGQHMGWRLQLESESFDLLLAHLPWSIGIVKLPWMTRPIFTDWPTP
ncbi:MAG: hypothetical protein B7Y41_04325 [Hydrogenophilales bacterium 28-61-23]|nr:MAG: hypothetical protein B7Y41_04325 [Hydrogenophilales bacterium 28-61-23]